MEETSNEPCAYCGARPTWPIVWTYDDVVEHVVYLCAECDKEEIAFINEEEMQNGKS